MITTNDVLGIFDRLLVWLPEHLDWLPAETAGYAVVPAVVVVILVVPALIVRRVLPWIGRYLVVPAVVVLAGAATAVMLVVDLVCTGAFRLLGLPLTGAHYAIGDWTIGGARAVRRATRYRVHQAGAWLRRFSRLLLLLAGVVAVVMWSRGYCARNPADGCAEPIGQWWHAVDAALRDLAASWA